MVELASVGNNFVFLTVELVLAEVERRAELGNVVSLLALLIDGRVVVKLQVGVVHVWQGSNIRTSCDTWLLKRRHSNILGLLLERTRSAPVRTTTRWGTPARAFVIVKQRQTKQERTG